MPVKCPKCQTDNPDTVKFCGECGTQIPSLKTPRPEVTETLQTPIKELTTGSTFANRYQVIEELGKGGMGKVYKVFDKETNSKVALKLIKPEVAADKNTIERFKNELKVARDISHKHICRMYDLGRDADNYFITMEFVSGGDLKKLIRRTKRLDTGTAISIARQICEGLEEAHSLGIVHRDLKPNNIMIDDNGNARIMDFGIARTLKEKGITGAGVMIGTPEYMSPEQVEAKEVDQRSDIYSLGVIMYEMLTGRLPFEADTPFAVGIKQKSETPKSPKDYNPQISDNLSGVILKCLEKEKERRYQSAEEVKSNLAKIERGLPTTERSMTKVEPKTVKIGEIKLKNLVLYGGISILLLAIIICSIFMISGRQKVMDSIAILLFENRSGDPELDYWSEGITDSIISKLTQLPSLKRVIARTSLFHYRGRNINPKEIGLELGVDVVLISQIDKLGEELSIRTELVDTSDSNRIWGNQYKLENKEIFNVQDHITNSIVDHLKLKLTGEEKKNLLKRYTENVEAYDLYLMGRFFWNKRTQDGLYKSIEYFNKSIDIDPNYALAYSGLADAYHILSSYGYIEENEGYNKAREASLKALNIDYSLAEAYASLARIKHVYDWDWTGAEKDFIKALELNNSCVTALQWYSTFLGYMGRHDEDIEMIHKAFELDPFSVLQNRSLGRRYLRARLYDKAIEALQKALEMDPDFPLVQFDLGRAYFFNSNYQEALTIFQERNDKYGIALTYLKMGNDEQAKDLLARWTEESKTSNVSTATIAELCFALGENDKGFVWLNQAYEEKNGDLLSIKINPFFDSVRTDSRFIEILKKMKLE